MWLDVFKSHQLPEDHSMSETGRTSRPRCSQPDGCKEQLVDNTLSLRNMLNFFESLKGVTTNMEELQVRQLRLGGGEHFTWMRSQMMRKEPE